MPDALDVLAGALAAGVGVGASWRAGRRGLALPFVVMAAVVALLVRRYAEAPMLIAAGTGLLLAMPYRHRLIPVYAGTVALLLAASELPDTLELPGDATAVVVASMAAAGALGWVAARRLGGGLAWVLVAASACAVYAAVPDTEHITVVAVAAAVAALVVVAGGDHDAPVPSAVAVLAALVVWCAAWGAIGRPASFVVGPGTLVPIVAVVAAIRPGRTITWRKRVGAPIVVGVHAGVAVILTRSAGLEPSIGRAVTIGAVVVGVGGLVLGTVVRLVTTR